MKRNWWRSLQVRIIAWSFVPTVIILSAVAWFTFYSYQKVLEDQAIKQDSEIVQTKTGQYFGVVNELVNTSILPIFMKTDTPNEAPLEARIQNILNNTPGLDVFDGGIYFLDRFGNVIKSQPEQPEVLGQNWSDIPQFNYVKQHPNVGAITDLFYIRPSGKKIFCVTMAMLNTKTELVGAGFYCFVIYPVAQSVYYQKLSSLDLGSGFYILDKNLQVIFSQNPSEIGNEMPGKAYIQRQIEQGGLSGSFRIENKDFVVSYVRIGNEPDGLNWTGINERSWAEIMQPSLAYRQLLLVLLALGVIVPMLVTAYGVRHITNPVKKLIHATEQVTAGQFQHRIEVKTGDEIETLAEQFNLMSTELDDSYSLLEKKVAERTHELETLNAIAARVSSSLDLNEIMADALERIMELTGMEHGMAYRIEGGEGGAASTGTDAEESHLCVMASRGMPPTYANLGDRLPLRQSAAGVAGRRSEPMIWTLTELPTDSNLKKKLVTLGVEQVIAIPLMTKGRLVGSLNLSTNQSRIYPPEQIALLKTIGQQIGVAVENARLYEQAKQTAIAAERNRLARELHDAVTQTLFSANIIADVLPRIWKRNPDEGMQNLEELRQLTRGALAEMRTMLLEMRPESLELVDIKALLKQLSDAFNGRVRIPVNLSIQGECELNHEVKLVFYRVAQEALNNIAKHSGARLVELHLECHPGHMNLCIKDNGLGFDPNSITPEHLGIAIMRERAGSIGAGLKIDSQLGQGTTVELDWSLTRKD